MLGKRIRAGGIGKKVITFKYLGYYWSMPIIRFENLIKLIENGESFSLEDFNARRLNKPVILDYDQITDIEYIR